MMKRKNKTSLFKSIAKALPVLAGLAVVIYAASLVKDIEFPTVLPIKKVEVVGELKFLNKAEIESAVKASITGGYFTVDLTAVREVLMHKPWVKNVSLRRKWPVSINVFITEQVPVAYWNNDAYLGEDGNVFKPEYIDKTLNLPVLNGPEGQHNNVWKFMNVLYKETAMLNYEVVRLVLDERRAWQLVIAADDGVQADNIEVKLGRFDTDKRMRRFVRILPALADGQGLTDKQVQTKKIKLIDMRYPNGFAVQIAGEDGAVSQNITDRYAVDDGVYESASRSVENYNYKTENLSHEFVSGHKRAAKQMSEA